MCVVTIIVLEIHDCCIRMTVLLEYFDGLKVSNAAGQRAKGVIF